VRFISEIFFENNIQVISSIEQIPKIAILSQLKMVGIPMWLALIVEM
jgi:hypothetical protein